MLDGLKAWLWWRLPRLWMNRTAYAFWVEEQRRRLKSKIAARRALTEGEQHGDR